MEDSKWQKESGIFAGHGIGSPPGDSNNARDAADRAYTSRARSCPGDSLRYGASFSTRSRADEPRRHTGPNLHRWDTPGHDCKIGRASCRERVEISAPLARPKQ